MDTITPQDLYQIIKRYRKQYNLEEYNKNIEKYFILKQATVKWHKRKKLPKVLSAAQKELLNEKQLRKYYMHLKQHFFFEKYLINDMRQLNNEEEEQLTDDEYCMYLKELRLKVEHSIIDNLPMPVYRLLHPILAKELEKDLISKAIKVKELNQEIPSSIGKRPIIFTLTHVGVADITVFSKAIPKKHYTILSGDFESLHNRIEGLAFRLNRAKFFDMRSKEDRAKVEDIVVETLKKDHLLCSMEAVWNTTPNKNIQDLFSGMITAALKANAVILPVGIERFDGKYYGYNVSQQYFDAKEYFQNCEFNKENLKKATAEVRQLMADAKGQLYIGEDIQSQITTTREKIGDYETYSKKFKQEVLSGWTFTEENIREKSYRNPEDPTIALACIQQKYSTLLIMNQQMNSELCTKEEKARLRIRYYRLYAEFLCELKINYFRNYLPSEIYKSLEQIYNKLNINSKTIYDLFIGNEHQINNLLEEKGRGYQKR